ncbi:hypothetical protein FB451DRAFT_1569081 [Mycena latifolia]|nr:hypothetical protein FB451DRAFT_1569081 [Mycena latifolia]
MLSHHDEVKRIVLGPRTWSPNWSSSAVIQRQIALPLDANWPWIKLLPGGRYFVLHHPASVKLFDTATGQNMWTYTPAHSDAIRCWELDLRQGLDSVCFVLVSSDEQRNFTINVLHIDLMNGQSDVLMRCPLPADMLHPPPPVILGDLFAMTFQPVLHISGFILLVNWRSSEYLLFKRFRALRACLRKTGPVLVPGHLGFVAEHGDMPVDRAQFLQIYRLASFSLVWRPISAINLHDVVCGPEVTPFICERLDVFEARDLTVYESPLRRDTFEFRVHVPIRYPTRSIVRFLLPRKFRPEGFSRIPALLSYSFDLSGPSPVWRLRSREQIQFRVWEAKLSFSRYCVAGSYNTQVIDGLVERENVEENGGARMLDTQDRAGMGRIRYLSPYSSAVVSSTAYSLTIYYHL